MEVCDIESVGVLRIVFRRLHSGNDISKQKTSILLNYINAHHASGIDIKFNDTSINHEPLTISN